MFILKELVSIYIRKKNISYLLVISALRGWGLFNLKKNYFCLKNKSDGYQIIGQKNASLENQLTSMLFGYLKNYIQYLALIGLGYKANAIAKKSILFRLGKSHRTLFFVGQLFQVIYFSKQLLIFKGRSINKIKNTAFLLRQICKLKVYKKKGLCFKGELISLKDSSKKAKV